MVDKTQPPVVQPRLASAIMLLRDVPSGQGIEVFMVRRVIQSDFMPDVYVFPGGSVSADDRAAEQAEDICVPVAPAIADPEGRTILGSGARAAAIRELFEEAGVLLAYRSGEMLATDRLGYFAHWITPEGMPKRFDTHFFITTAPAEQQAAHDQLETSEGVWISPQEALDRSELNECLLVFATIHQLQELAVFESVKEALEATTVQHVPTRIPLLVEEDGVMRVYLPEDAVNRWDVPEHMTKKR